MNFTALKAAVAARGFQYLTDAQLGVYINDARRRLDAAYWWPYREKSVAGVAPVDVTDMLTIEAVENATLSQFLEYRPWQSLLAEYGDLTTAGEPYYYYVASPAGTPVVATYPTSATSSIGVQYWKRTVDLSSGGDTPAAPADYHQIIVEMAVQQAYLATDNFGAAQALGPFIDERVTEMAGDLLNPQASGPADFQGVSNASTDWGNDWP